MLRHDRRGQIEDTIPHPLLMKTPSWSPPYILSQWLLDLSLINFLAPYLCFVMNRLVPSRSRMLRHDRRGEIKDTTIEWFICHNAFPIALISPGTPLYIKSIERKVFAPVICIPLGLYTLTSAHFKSQGQCILCWQVWLIFM